MKILYLDVNMGAAGDMLTAALLELLPDPAAFMDELNALGIPGVHFMQESAAKCGIMGTRVRVLADGQEEGEETAEEHPHHHDGDHAHEHSHEHLHEHPHEHPHEHLHEHPHEHHHDHPHTHSHRGLSEIEDIVGHLKISAKAKEDILAVYHLIAEAESKMHGVPVEKIHFHEVGNLDAIADITAVSLLMERLNPDMIIASPIRTGRGQVRCAHGILPVPAPATAEILRGLPVFAGEFNGEMCTPTGAALLKHFVNRFEQMPLLRAEQIGYGMGRKDFPAANCVRALWGEAEEEADTVLELSCNLDDMPAEQIAFAAETLMRNGALDVFTLPCGMKKGRPGFLLTVLCRAEDREHMVRLIFKHSTTLGIRQKECRRYLLRRSFGSLSTPYGEIRRKFAEGYGVRREKLEYEDLAAAAKEHDLSIRELLQKIEK